MKILLIGQNLAKYNPTSLSESLYRGFIKNKIKCDKYDLSYYLTNKYFNYIVKKTPFLRSILLEESNTRLIEFLNYNKYSHLFIVKGTFLLPKTLRKIKQIHPNISLCCFNPDDPFNPQSWGGSNHSNILDSITYYTSYFIWSKKLVDKIKKQGVKNVYYTPFALDHKLIKTDFNTNEKYNLSFIGNSDNERQLWINNAAQLINPTNILGKIDVFGLYWKPFKNISFNGGKFGDDYFKVFYESKININILRSQNKGATNMRTFEIPATGNFMLHEESEEAKKYFRPDVDAVYFSSPEELIEKAEYYLKHETLRKKIAKSGFEKTKTFGYSYDDRVEEMIIKMKL